MRMMFDSAVELERVQKEYGAIEGFEQTLERLSEYIVKL
jgi:hypothetical protein